MFGDSSSSDEAAGSPVVAAVPPVRAKALQLQDSEDEDPPSPAVTSKPGKRKTKPASKKVGHWALPWRSMGEIDSMTHYSTFGACLIACMESLHASCGHAQNKMSHS